MTLQCVDQPKMMVTVWQDTKVVTATSANAQPLPHNKETRRMKTWEKKIFSCPQNITLYNQVLTEMINFGNITTYNSNVESTINTFSGSSWMYELPLLSFWPLTYH